MIISILKILGCHSKIAQIKRVLLMLHLRYQHFYQWEFHYLNCLKKQFKVLYSIQIKQLFMLCPLKLFFSICQFIISNRTITYLQTNQTKMYETQNDRYKFSTQQSRIQQARHYQSSMAQPNLENVEAQLRATRQKNHQLAMQYFRDKYGTTQKYDPIASIYRESGIKQKANFKEQLEREGEQIRRRQMQKIRRKALGIKIQEQEEQEVDRYGIKKEKHAKAKDNPWIQQKPKQKTNPGKQVSFKENIEEKPRYDIIQNVLDKSLAQSKFVEDFKYYLAGKEKGKEIIDEEQQLGLTSNKKSRKQKLFEETKYISSPIKQNKSKSKQKIVSNQKSKQSISVTHQQELVKKILKDITGQSTHSTVVQKVALVQYMIKNNKILSVLGLTQQSLNQKVFSYETKSSQQMSYKQLVFFILGVVGKQKQRKILESNWRQTNIPKGCMLKQQTINIFESIFMKLDKHRDLIVPRSQYITKLATDLTIKKLLNAPAVYEEQLDRSISMRRIFERIELQRILGTQSDQKASQYISWEEFLKYFESGHKDRGNYDLLLLINSLKSQQKSGLLDLSDLIIAMINRGFSKIDKGQQYFNTTDIIEAIRQDTDFEDQKYTMVRGGNQESGAHMETFNEVLSRILKNGYKFITVKQFLEYFSVRGKPIEQSEVQDDLLIKKNFSVLKSKQIQDNFTKKAEQIDGYDSDPQLYNSQLFYNKKSPVKQSRSPQKRPNTAMRKKDRSFDNIPQHIQNKEMKITVPAPFSFEQRQKNRQTNKNKKNLSLEKQMQSFKPKQIPKSVAEIGLFQKMQEEDMRKRQERKRNSMIMTLANEQPFSFLNRKVNKKTKYEREQFVFKAKPIPWYCSINLLSRKKQQEIQRNEKIAKKAQQNLSKAKLPPRMQKDFQQKLAKKITEQQEKMKQKSSGNQFIAKQPPDFQKIHKQFEDNMQRKKKQHKTTQVKEFNFAKINKRQKKNQSFDAQPEQIMRKTNMSLPKHTEPKYVASSTIKFTQLAEKRRKQIEEKRKQEDKRLKQQQERLKINEDLKARLMATQIKVEQDQQKRRQQNLKQIRRKDKEYQQTKKKIKQKANEQPLLINRPLKRDLQIQKMQRLAMISQTLKKNGIKGKQHDNYFKRQELLLLQDYQLFKKKEKNK